MENVTTTNTAPATRPFAATAGNIKAPRFPTTGTNEPLDAAIAAVQALFAEYVALDAASVAADEANGLAASADALKAALRAERRADAAVDRIDRALKAIQKIKVSSTAQALTKQHAGALGLALLATPIRKWRALSADQAIKAVGASMSDYRADLATLAASFARDVAAVTPPPGGAELEREVLRNSPDESPLLALLEESDRAFSEAGGHEDDTPEQIAADERAERLHRQFLRAPVATRADALVKLRWLSRGIHSANTGHETAVLAQLVTYFGGDPIAVLTVDPGYDCAKPEDLTFSFDPEAQDDATDRRAWDAAVAATRAAYQDFDGEHADLGPAIDRLLTLTPPDVEGLRFLFEVIMTETQALGIRAEEAREAGEGPLTDARLVDACNFPPQEPVVFAYPGNGLAAGLIHIRRALDRLTGQSAAPWNEFAYETDEDLLANAQHFEPGALIAAE